MNEQSLFERFNVSPLLNSLADRIAMSETQKSPFQIFLQHLNGSVPAFVLQTIFTHEKTNQWNHIVVLNDAEEAAYFFNSIYSFFSRDRIINENRISIIPPINPIT